MADQYMDNYANAYNSTPKVPFEKGKFNANMMCLLDKKTFTAATWLTTDDIVCGNLPAGAIVHEVIVSSVAVGATGNFKVGWDSNGTDAADDDGFFTSVDNTGQAVLSRMSAVAGIAGQFKEFAAETTLRLTTLANTAAFTGDVTIAVYYTVA